MNNSNKTKFATIDAIFIENKNGDLVQTFERDNLSPDTKDYLSHEKQAAKAKNKLMQGKL
jgi:hypothetical protein